MPVSYFNIEIHKTAHLEMMLKFVMKTKILIKHKTYNSFKFLIAYFLYTMR